MSNESWKEKNIEWIVVQAMPEPDVELVAQGTNAIFVFVHHGHREAVIIWSGQDAKKAQAWLSEVGFARCAHISCGIRVKHLGAWCSTHGQKVQEDIFRLCDAHIDEAIRLAYMSRNAKMAGEICEVIRFTGCANSTMMNHLVARAVSKPVREAMIEWDELLYEADETESRS